MKKSLFFAFAIAVLVAVEIISERVEAGGKRNLSLQVQKGVNLFHEIIFINDGIIIEESNHEAVIQWIHYEKIFTIDTFGDTAFYRR